jgi:hypothetical protein
VRIKIRVPAGYLLVKPYDTTRPALLVLDAEGRRVDSIKLLGAKPAEVAERLRAARIAPAQERFVVSKDNGARQVLTGPVGKHTPDTLLEQGYTIHEPVPVVVDGKTRYVARLLVSAGDDLESRTFALPGVPKGARGCRVALAPLAVDGVVSVFPDIFAEKQRVVARKGTDWKKVRAAFADEGCTPR